MVRIFDCPTACVQARVNGQGSMCNQAIMLITDGAMEDFESVFEEFNWPERRVRTKAVLHISFWSFYFLFGHIMYIPVSSNKYIFFHI